MTADAIAQTLLGETPIGRIGVLEDQFFEAQQLARFSIGQSPQQKIPTAPAAGRGGKSDAADLRGAQCFHESGFRTGGDVDNAIRRM